LDHGDGVHFLLPWGVKRLFGQSQSRRAEQRSSKPPNAYFGLKPVTTATRNALDNLLVHILRFSSIQLRSHIHVQGSQTGRAVLRFTALVVIFSSRKSHCIGGSTCFTHHYSFTDFSISCHGSQKEGSFRLLDSVLEYPSVDDIDVIDYAFFTSLNTWVSCFLCIFCGAE
jgi:hypothetical protein